MAICIDLRKSEPQVYFPKKPDIQAAKFLIAVGAILAGIMPWLLVGITGQPSVESFIVGLVFGFLYGYAIIFTGMSSLDREIARMERQKGLAILQPWDDVGAWVYPPC